MTRLYKAIGLDIGAVNIKVCGIDFSGQEHHFVAAHEGSLDQALAQVLAQLHINDSTSAKAMVTGGAGRHRLPLPDVILPRAIEAGLKALDLCPRAVVSLGGEDLVVYILNEQGHIQNCYAGNKCASGTGEFLRQQLGRMDLTLDDLPKVAAQARVLKLSARCSVFMKSDCTHRLNKGEATRGDIALSLCKVMADKVSDFLVRAKISAGQVALVGGVTQNKFLLDFLGQALPEVDFLVPPQARFFEAFGAAHLAISDGAPLPKATLTKQTSASYSFGLFAPLSHSKLKVNYFASRRAPFRPEANYILGVDGGSTTTKVALVDQETMEIAAAHYDRTHGDPVAALKRCLREVLAQLNGQKPRITLCATTGSSRELLGVFLETAGVYNEIIAHAVGTTFFDPGVQTIFEIGGQDAKYVLLNNGVPIDYAMNEACSAGTGSFLEESASGDLDIRRAEDIGPIAMQASAPLKFGEHCSAFINSDIRQAIQQGATRPDIVAGLVFSIVSNYLNRVVGNRQIGDRLALQGGVAKNPAVPLAFAQLLGKPVCVPPDPELMGCFGVARLAAQKYAEGLLSSGEFILDEILRKEITTQGEFTCQACDNRCPIKRLEVNGQRYPFGGRCSKFSGARRRKNSSEHPAADLVDWRQEQLFNHFSSNVTVVGDTATPVVGVPRVFSVHSLWPFYSRFFSELGVATVLSDRVLASGIARQESNYCFPVEIAHGAMQDMLERSVDFYFLPHFRDMPSLESGKVHACVCPLTQGLPFYLRQAFDLEESRILRPLVSFKHRPDACREEFAQVAVKLGQSLQEGRRAFDAALSHYEKFRAAYRQRGRELLDEMARHPDHIYLALLGRPYNAFTPDANMGIPRKFSSRGVTVVPFDMIFDDDAPIFPNMYWHYGQQDLKAVAKVKEIPNLYLTWSTNFSCAPDSFMLHYLRWMMGQKPYLVLEIDSHTADAGLDTRIEAFLDIVDSYRRHQSPPTRPPRPRRYHVERKNGKALVVDRRTNQRLELTDPRVTLIWPSMGDLATEAAAAVARKQGLRTANLPVPDVRSTQLARDVSSGKECIPALLVLGGILQYMRERPVEPLSDEVTVCFVPSTLGPCRTGQYHVFYDRLFDELGLDEIALLVGESETSYSEFGPGFSRDLWRALTISDYFTDIRLGIKLLAADVEAGLCIFDQCWKEIIGAIGQNERVLLSTLARCAEKLGAIKRRREISQLKQVLIVGEIYVRRDSFSIEELCAQLISHDIFPKVAGLTEWVHYTDWAQKYELDVMRQRDGLLPAISQGWLGKRTWLGVERWWKHRVEKSIQDLVFPTGLLPTFSVDMNKALVQGGQLFVDPALESEATVSPAVAATSMQEGGYSGIVIIAPFGCLIGRLIEGVYAPWSKAQGYPVVAIENDGQAYPPNVIARLEVFAHNVRRFNPALAPLPASPQFDETSPEAMIDDSLPEAPATA